VLRAPPLQAQPLTAVKALVVAAARVETERVDLAPADFELVVLVRLPSSQEQAARPALNCQANSIDERDKHEPT
jgi:hypothetical protein